MKALLACSALLWLSACELVGRIAPDTEARAQPARASTAAPSAGEDLLAYLARLRGMNEAALNAEAARQKQAAARGDDTLRIKAALAMSLASQSDEGEIAALVDPLVRRETNPAELRAMASFLHVIANERRRLRESAAATRTNLNNERRAAEAQKQRADALQERAAQLQQKLDALTELEKSLSDRPQPSR